MNARTLPVLLLSLSLAACAGSGDTDATDDTDTTMDSEAAADDDTDDVGAGGDDTDDTDDTDGGSAPMPVTTEVYAQGWEELPAPQSIYVGAPDEMALVDDVNGEVGGIRTLQQSPPYNAASGDWGGYMQVRSYQTGTATATLKTTVAYTVQAEGERHDVRVRVGRNTASVPNGGLTLSLYVGADQVDSFTLDKDSFSFLGNYPTITVSYTAVADDVGKSMDVRLSTHQGPGSGVWSVLFDDLKWEVTR